MSVTYVDPYSYCIGCKKKDDLFLCDECRSWHSEFNTLRRLILGRLREISHHSEDDYERSHYEADCLLLELLADDEVRAAYSQVGKYYA